MAEEKKIATGYIGNALRSSAADHTTTFTDEVFDTKRQKYQSEVNADIEERIVAEKNRAEAAEQANAQAITDEVARAQAAEKAIIFDVSAHNNGAVFESLQALLSSDNLDTLIPVSFRHGGMTIRFIQGSEQSADNKYVQYRLMSDTFSTTESDWQGVDNVPTAGSKNLVESGGVALECLRLNEKLIELVGFGTTTEQTTGITEVGQYYYNTYFKKIKKCISYHNPPVASDFEDVLFYDGAIYLYQNELYVWNGTDLINKTEADNAPTPVSPNLVKSGGTNRQLDILRGILGESVACKQIIGGLSNTPVQITDYNFKAGKSYNITIIVANAATNVNVVLRPSSDTTTYLKKEMKNGTYYFTYTPALDIVGLYLSIYKGPADVTITFVDADNLSSKVIINEGKLVEYDKYVGRFPAINNGDILQNNEIVGSLNINRTYNTIEPASSNNWRYCQWAATEKTWYAVETGMAERNIRTAPYVFATDDNNVILGMFFAPSTDDTTMHQFPRMMIYLPEGTTKLWVLRWFNNSLSIYAEKANSLFNSYAEAINVLNGKMLTESQVEQISETIAQATINNSDVLSAIISEYIAEHPSTFDNAALLQTTNLSVTVGNGGNYNTINAALDALSRLHKILNIKATITLKAGFVIAEQITVDSTDMSWIDIISEDESVAVNGSAISSVNINVPAHSPYVQVLLNCIFAARNGATLPNIKFLMVVDNSGSNVTGIGVYNNSKAFVADNCGCNGADVNIYLIEHGYVNAMGANFSKAKGNGISCFRSSSLVFGGGKAICCNNNGIYVDANSDAELSGADFSYAGITYTEENGVITPIAAIANINGAGIEVGPACKIQAQSANASYCKRGILCYNGGWVAGREMTIIGAMKYGNAADGGQGIHCRAGSKVETPSAIIHSCAYAGVLAENGADVIVNGVTNNQEHGCNIVARGSSTIKANGTYARRGASDSDYDIMCEGGSVILATEATGGTNITPNTISSRGLIIK